MHWRQYDAAGGYDMSMTAHPSPLVRDAEDLTRQLLSEDSDRLAHSKYAASIAEVAADVLGLADPQALIAAAWLHDIGYLPALSRTGFHPLDGALFLAEEGWPDETVLLVAHHSHADVLASYYDVEAHLAVLDHARAEAEDILAYADLRSGTTGMGALADQRIAEMRIRHAENPSVPVDVREARYELLLRTAARVSAALNAQPHGLYGRRRSRATSLSGARLRG